jgi:hypothetical protein
MAYLDRFNLKKWSKSDACVQLAKMTHRVSAIPQSVIHSMILHFFRIFIAAKRIFTTKIKKSA